jgi:hypothetical protein
MAGVNKLLTFASADGALVQSDDAYASDPGRLAGFQNGVADPAHVNKVWRQGAFGSAALGQFLVDYLGVDAADDGNVSAFKLNLRAAFAEMLSGVYEAQDTSTTVNVIQAALDPAPVSGTGFRSIYIRIKNTNTGPVTIALNTLGSKNVTRHDGSPLQARDLPGGQLAHFLFDPVTGQYVLAGLGGAEVQRIVSGVTLYVRTDGSDTNDGSANDPQHAFLTPAAAIMAASRFSAVGGAVTIRLGNAGTYPAPNAAAVVGSNIIIYGDPNNQGNYILSGPGGQGVPPVAAVGCQINLIGLSISNSGTTNYSAGASNGGNLSLNNVTFYSVPGSALFHVAAFGGGSVAINGGNVFTSSMGGWAVASGGAITFAGGTVGFTGNPAWSDGGVKALNNGNVQFAAPVTISGTATGPRFSVSLNGTINTSGSGTNFFPGSVTPSAPYSTGGQYA